ncbi:hypothetical protein BP5796_01228 [Coleophoma crateriformis]|uniref:Thioredoxin domain-containing protein n=1 Tax=Coleophoma crateriformis TaxID=565419 RepID=A0A3D8SZW2_9HELO|nr:hypothetical protein BP5796_01228 [Coleophoma crateriformis]
MAEVEEPQFTSVSARIAALKQQNGFKPPMPAPSPAGKRPPPPPPPTGNRPALEARSKTTNNPPIATYGSSVTKKANNEPIGINGLALRPPPPVDRDQLQVPDNQVARVPPKLPSRNSTAGPPPLPNRKASEPSPSLPPRNSSTQVARRGSNSSTMTSSSSVSGLSLSRVASSTTSISSTTTETPRKLPPALGDTKLPPLPPSRRETEEKAKAVAKIPLISTKSAPEVLRQKPSMSEIRPGFPPRVPARPGRSSLLEEGPRPVLPSRPSRTNVAEEEPAPAPRKLPPTATARSILSMGFNNKPTPVENPNQAQPQPQMYNQPAKQVYNPPAKVIELTQSNFDSYVMSGRPALVDFYAPYCKYCKELDPIYVELAQNFGHAQDSLTIAKMDVDKYKAYMTRFDIQGYPTIMFFDGYNETPKKYQWGRQLDNMSDFLEQETGLKPQPPSANGVPPPINQSSKPSRAQVQAAAAKPVAAAAPTSGCLLCRDFSGPDGVAAQYPRQSLPRTGDMTGYLAQVLCGPFSSATDKARAIFTWLHHNIAYDVDAFFGNRVKHVEPKDTIASGLAVCGGYAGVYSAVALKAGLECVMVTGHGKGYGYTASGPGDPIPPCNPSGHAWNAVRIDNGEWKLLDACWGAGNVGNQVYNKHFTSSCFTRSNEDFGIKHFPQDDSYFFRSDGRIPTWAEYIRGPTNGEPLQIFGSAEDQGLQETSFTPAAKHISTRPGSEIVRFQFSKVCEHWDHERNGKGKPYCFVLKIGGVDGRKEDYVPFETNGFWWWCDIPAKDLGAPGQTVSCYTVATVNGKDVRGLTKEEYLGKKGRCAMSFGGVAAWKLV